MSVEIKYKTTDGKLVDCNNLVIENGMVKCRFEPQCSAHVPISHVHESFFINGDRPITETQIRVLAKVVN